MPHSAGNNFSRHFKAKPLSFQVGTAPPLFEVNLQVTAFIFTPLSRKQNPFIRTPFGWDSQTISKSSGASASRPYYQTLLNNFKQHEKFSPEKLTIILLWCCGISLHTRRIILPAVWNFFIRATLGEWDRLGLFGCRVGGVQRTIEDFAFDELTLSIDFPSIQIRISLDSIEFPSIWRLLCNEFHIFYFMFRTCCKFSYKLDILNVLLARRTLRVRCHCAAIDSWCSQAGEASWKKRENYFAFESFERDLKAFDRTKKKNLLRDEKLQSTWKFNCNNNPGLKGTRDVLIDSGWGKKVRTASARDRFRRW